MDSTIPQSTTLNYAELRRVEKYSHAAGLFVMSVWMDSIIPKSTTLIQNLKYLHAGGLFKTSSSMGS